MTTKAPDPDIVIRPYEPQDRDAVRHICFVTGDIGDPVEWTWKDKESFSDMFTGYYTDREPQSALVAELDGEVAGYLLGCVDTRRAWNPGKVAGRHIVRRGIAFRPGTAGMVWRGFVDGFFDWRHHELPPMSSYDVRWPAHLHIDLLPELRGKGAGAALMHTWLDSLRDRGVAGCHLETTAENTNAVAFFEAMGFERHGRLHPAPGVRSKEGERRHILLMVRPLGPPPEDDDYVGAVSERRKNVKPIVGIIGVVGTMASIWWFALRPRRKRRKAGG